MVRLKVSGTSTEIGFIPDFESFKFQNGAIKSWCALAPHSNEVQFNSKWCD